MPNPWLKKNPFLSLWLSGANAVAGSLRGHASRNATTALSKAAQDMTQLWAGALAPPKRKPAKKRRKR